MKTRTMLGSWLLIVAMAAVGCHTPKLHNLPPAARMMEPGPGVGGPGPGVIPPAGPPPTVAPASYNMPPAGAGLAGPGCGPNCYGGHPGGALGPPPHDAPTVQLWFASPEGGMVRWDVGGVNHFDSSPLVIPGRQNFPQGGIYRLKLTNIEGAPGVELYPTIEIAPATPRSSAYLEHNAIPIQFTIEDFDQVLAGNFVTKVIYLPDPEFQELALAGVETLVSTRLDPGIDPIVEADRRGAILAIIRLGNKDLETPAGYDGVAPASHVDGAPTDGASLAPGGLQSAAPEGNFGAPDADHNVNAGPPLAPIGDYGHAAPPFGGEHGYPGPAPAGDHGYGGPGAGYQEPVASAPAGLPPPYVVGVTSPMYGMPFSGTPIGLPGPAHIPLGGPARLQKHKMWNWTKHDFPRPVHKQSIHVNQRPGFSYPHPPRRAFIRTEMIHSAQPYHQPHGDKFHVVQPGYPHGSHQAPYGGYPSVDHGPAHH